MAAVSQGFHRPLRLAALYSQSPVMLRLWGDMSVKNWGCGGALLAYLGGLPFKDVVNVHGLPELHVLKGK